MTVISIVTKVSATTRFALAFPPSHSAVLGASCLDHVALVGVRCRLGLHLCSTVEIHNRRLRYGSELRCGVAISTKHRSLCCDYPIR